MKTIFVDAWNTFVTKDGINHNLREVLNGYKNPKIILTNANKQECIDYGILNMPYEVFSLEHDPNKTDKAYYLKMLDHFNLRPEHVIYLEHHEEAVNSAISAGIRTFHFKKEENQNALIAFLKNNLK